MSKRTCYKKTYQLNDAQRGLVEEHYGLVFFTVNKFFHISPQHREDVIQIGAIGLCRAAFEYDPARQSTYAFSSFAVNCIKRHIQQYYIGLYAQKRDFRNELMILDTPIGGTSEKKYTLADYLADTNADTEAAVSEKLAVEALLAAIDCAPLTERERFVMERLLTGDSLMKISEKLNISKTSTFRAMNSARHKIQPLIER